MERNLIKKRELEIAMTSFYKERRKKIKESPTQAYCLGTSKNKNYCFFFFFFRNLANINLYSSTLIFAFLANIAFVKSKSSFDF
jgi:hypothetical protein